MNHMDYILHPIPLSDINRPIYYMVRSFFLHLVGGLPHDDLYEEWERVKVEATFGDYLVFPSADLSVSYDCETLKREVIILKNCSIIHKDYTDVPREAYLFGKEDSYAKTTYEPHEEYYYIDIDPVTNEYVARKEIDTFEWKVPTFFNNTVQFKRALKEMIATMDKVGLKDGYWSDRLQSAINMLEAKVNELHILHNAGLYDFNILERILANTCRDELLWRSAFDDYIFQVKVFAMYVLNNMNWGMNGTEFGEDPEQSDMIDELEKERKRRSNML